jgi:hypothetical protein
MADTSPAPTWQLAALQSRCLKDAFVAESRFLVRLFARRMTLRIFLIF